MEAARNDDPELNELREMLEAWACTLGVGYKHRFTLAEVIKIINETVLGNGGGFVPEWPRLTAAVQAISKKKVVDVDDLGKWMRKNNGRMVGNHRFVSRSSRKTSWWIEGEDAPGERKGAEADAREQG